MHLADDVKRQCLVTGVVNASGVTQELRLYVLRRRKAVNVVIRIAIRQEYVNIASGVEARATRTTGHLEDIVRLDLCRAPMDACYYHPTRWEVASPSQGARGDHDPKVPVLESFFNIVPLVLIKIGIVKFALDSSFRKGASYPLARGLGVQGHRAHAPEGQVGPTRGQPLGDR